jgi:hypothetical protein
MIYLLTAVGLSPGGSSTVHIYTQTIRRTTQIQTNVEVCGPCPVFASFTLAFALQLREKARKNLSLLSYKLHMKRPRWSTNIIFISVTDYNQHHTSQTNLLGSDKFRPWTRGIIRP